MTLAALFSSYKKHQETQLFGRYIHHKMIEPLLKNLPDIFKFECVGKSVLGKPIYTVKVGSGKKRIFLWSQMHGNESTTTKAIFDVFNTFQESNEITKCILNECTLLFIPILNPDGADAYTRLNANDIDLNRDAKALTQLESKVLREQFDAFKPDYCFNLHGQRTIFSVGKANNVATLSFLAPAEDELRSLTATRKKAMEIIAVVSAQLQKKVPNSIGRYDDTYNENCVGDTFQSFGIPTILYEAGHFKDDYNREKTREYIYLSLLTAIQYIADNPVKGVGYEQYFDIPQNDKCFLDIIIRNAIVCIDGSKTKVDLGFMYQEKLIDNKIIFKPILEKIERLDNYFGHYELDASNNRVLTPELDELFIGFENDFVLVNNEKYSLLLTKS